MTEEVTQEATPEITQAPTAPSLGLADLKNVLIIIDLASSRGAFRTAEFAAVGSVYAKVEAFLAAAAPAPEATATEEAPAEAAAE
jgi:hypothetical protein